MSAARAAGRRQRASALARRRVAGCCADGRAGGRGRRAGAPLATRALGLRVLVLATGRAGGGAGGRRGRAGVRRAARAAGAAARRLAARAARGRGGALLLAAPLVVYDALAMFGGHPGVAPAGTARCCRAAGGAGGAGAGAGLAGRSSAAGLARCDRAAAAGRAAALAGGAGRRPGCSPPTAWCCPRLYPWFHLSLALASRWRWSLAVPLRWPGAPRRRPGRRAGGWRWRWRWPVRARASAWRWCAGSHTLLFVAHERTQLLAPALRGCCRCPRRRAGPAGRARAGPRPSGRAAAARGPAPAGRRRRADHRRCPARRSRRRLRLRAPHHAEHRRPGAPRGALRARLHPGAAHLVLGGLDADRQVLPDAGPAGARRRPRHRGRCSCAATAGRPAAFYPPAVFFVDADKLKAYQRQQLPVRVREGRVPRRPRAADQIAEFFAQREARAGVPVGALLRAARALRRAAGARLRRRGTSIATTARSPTPTRPWAGCWPTCEKHRPGAIVILTADHGEEFDEHGGRYHGTTLYDEQVRVPLIIAVPGVSPARGARARSSWSIWRPPSWACWTSRSRCACAAPIWGPGWPRPPAPGRRLAPAFAEVDEQRMVATARDKLICEIDKGFCALLRPRGRSRREARTWPRRARNGWRSCAPRLDGWLDEHVALRAAAGARTGRPATAAGACPGAIERGAAGRSRGGGRAGGAAAVARTPLPVRREAARLLATVLPPRAGDAGALVRGAARRRRPEVRDWAAVAGRAPGGRHGAGARCGELCRPGPAPGAARGRGPRGPGPGRGRAMPRGGAGADRGAGDCTDVRAVPADHRGAGCARRSAAPPAPLLGAPASGA